MLSSILVKNGILQILNYLVNAGRGRKRDEEEGRTRRKMEGGGRKDEEERGTRRAKKKVVNEKENNKAKRPTMRPLIEMREMRGRNPLESCFVVIHDFLCLLDHFCT